MSTLNLYRTKPQEWRKASAEIRQDGHKAYVPLEHFVIQRKLSNGKIQWLKTRRPAAPGWMPATGKPAFAKHVGKNHGPFDKAELKPLYGSTRIRLVKPAARKFAKDDVVQIKVGPFASLHGPITADDGFVYTVDVKMLGKVHNLQFREQQLRPYDPG